MPWLKAQTGTQPLKISLAGWQFLKDRLVLGGLMHAEVGSSLESWLWFNSVVVLSGMSSIDTVYLWAPHCLWKVRECCIFMFPLQFMKTVLFSEKDCKQSFAALLPTRVGNVYHCKIFFTSWAETLTGKYSLTSHWWLSSGKQLTQTQFRSGSKDKSVRSAWRKRRVREFLLFRGFLNSLNKIAKYKNTPVCKERLAIIAVCLSCFLQVMCPCITWI